MEAPGVPSRKELLLRGRGVHYVHMLVIRLFRVGKKNQPAFRIVVTNKRKPPRGGRFVEEVGFYNPLTKEKVLKEERIKYWLSVGAKPSETIYNLLVSEKIIEGKKIPVHKKSKKPAAVETPAGKEEPSFAKASASDKSSADKSGDKGKPAEETSKEEKTEKAATA